MARLDGRVAVVTGAGRGIGRSVAKLLASEGACVVVNDLGAAVDGSGRDAGPAREVAAEIGAAGGKAVANGADISDHAAAGDLVRTAIEQFGRLDVLVNVAGILRDRMVFNMTEQEWDDVIRVHLKGTFNTTKFASAHWRSLRDSAAQNRIINFTSVSGLHGAPGQPNYAAAKMGIVGLTYSSARSLARYGVTVNAISPGASTRMTDSVPAGRRRPAAPDGQRSPDHVAPVVAYLASERSGWITGRVIHAAGYEVSLYSNPEPVIRIVGTGPWDPGTLGEQVERAFGPALGRLPGRLGVPGRDGADDGEAFDEEVDALEELEQVAVFEHDLAVHDRALRVVAFVQRLPVPVVHGEHVGRLGRLVLADDPALGHRAAVPLHEQVAGQVPAAQRPGCRVTALDPVEEVPVLPQLARSRLGGRACRQRGPDRLGPRRAEEIRHRLSPPPAPAGPSAAGPPGRAGARCRRR
jgi:NAD(P)-dependent dehydrogenase (short-subunit alcohol dehydrogenase family)